MKRILIVEDDESLRDIFEIIFSRAGYQASVFTKSAEVSYSDWSKADIIFLDVRLPGKDGLQLCSELKEDPVTAKKPVVIISASPRERYPHYKGCEDAFIEKPFNAPELISLVQQLI